MKKLLVTTAATLLTVAAFAQGTVAFSNGGLNKISTGVVGSASTTWVSVSTTANQFNYGLFYGIGESTSLTFLSTQLGVNSSTAVGVIASPADGKAPLTAVGIPGTASGETDVWIQIAGWSASFGTDWAAAKTAASQTPGDYFGQSAVVNVIGLGPTTGPGQSFWSTAAQTSPNLQHGGIALLTVTVPEPTTMTLAGLGLASLLIFRRRNSK